MGRRVVRARQYGSVIMRRGVCQTCGDPCLICKDGTSSCCGAPTKANKRGYVSKETSGTEKRKKPSKEAQASILTKQDNKCYWCDREFGEYVLTPRENIKKLTPVWDHYVPYDYTGSCRNDQFVAACQRCNSHKSARLVLDLEHEDEVKKILKRLWYKGGWEDLNERKDSV